jgi:hypothetical protein
MGLELPKKPETLSMPSNDSFGFYNDQSFPPIVPETGKDNP